MIDCTWFTKFNYFKSIVFIEINCTKQKNIAGWQNDKQIIPVHKYGTKESKDSVYCHSKKKINK